jgi:hypothetical protein
MHEIKIKLKDILDTMDIPEMRKDLNNKSNVSWLIRNIGIRNQEHIELNFAVRLLCDLVNE